LDVTVVILLVGYRYIKHIILGKNFWAGYDDNPGSVVGGKGG
jgi:hypothetical protein